jgi:hypothetical protein
MTDSSILFTRAQLRETGLTDRQLDTRLANGSVVPVRRGVLQPLSGSVPDSARAPTDGLPPIPDLEIPVSIRAALLASPGRDLVASHATAAQLLGLPKPLAGWPQPHFTATSGPTRHRSGVHIRVARLSLAEVGDHHGIALTSPARTVADCLRTLPGRDGLAMLDAALHRGLVRIDAVLEILSSQARWPGTSRARQVLALANSRRESPLESWSAWAFAHTDVPAPEWQAEVRDRDGLFIARADCWWSAGVVGEADGRSKYALAAAERGGDAKAVFDVLQAERRREQRLRDVGADVVRWSTGEVLKEPAARRLAQRIIGAISLAQDGSRFTGVVAPTMLQLTTGPSD